MWRFLRWLLVEHISSSALELGISSSLGHRCSITLLLLCTCLAKARLTTQWSVRNHCFKKMTVVINLLPRLVARPAETTVFCTYFSTCKAISYKHTTTLQLERTQSQLRAEDELCILHQLSSLTAPRIRVSQSSCCCRSYQVMDGQENSYSETQMSRNTPWCARLFSARVFG